jgi:hypothetical protein
MKWVALLGFLFALFAFSSKENRQKHYKTVKWGFFGHEKINYYAVFLLPPELIELYKKNSDYLVEHSVDPDKRRYAITEEAPRHYIDLDYYGKYPFDTLPRNWNDALNSFSNDTLQKHGIVPYWVEEMQRRLVKAFKDKKLREVLRISAEIGHYIGDMHVPLHTTSNYNGQKTNQNGIHGFWESRVPELLAETEWDFVIEKADYIENVNTFIWKRVLESAKAVDSVLSIEVALNKKTRSDKKYAFENRKDKTIRQYSSSYTKAYNKQLNGMIERRFRQSVYSVASFWYTAWVQAGQPAISSLIDAPPTEEEKKELEQLNLMWKQGKAKGRICD